MNKYMLALLLAAPGAMYAMEQGDAQDPNPEHVFLEKFGAFEKEMQEVKEEVTSLKSDVEDLQKGLATLKKEEESENGGTNPQLQIIEERVALATLWGKIIELEKAEGKNDPLYSRETKNPSGSLSRKGFGSIIPETQNDRLTFFTATHVLIQSYYENQFKEADTKVLNSKMTRWDSLITVYRK